MVQAVVLTCPRCDARYAVPVESAATAKANLLRVADGHLATHDLRESDAALRKHAMAGRSEERDVEEAVVNEWVDAAEAVV